MLYFVLEKEGRGFPKGQIRRKAETQSLWSPIFHRGSQVAEENKSLVNPKVLPLGFFIGEKMRLPRSNEEGVYRITVRGNGSEPIFKDVQDYETFLEIIKSRKEKYNFKLYAFCLLPQYYQVLIETTSTANISKIMQALNTSYALYFNKKYNRTGHLVSNRFESRLINKDNSIFEVIHKIHLEPLRRRLTSKLNEYKYSSYPEYLGIKDSGVTDIAYIKSLGFVAEEAKNEEFAPGARLGLHQVRDYRRNVPAVLVASLTIVLVILGIKISDNLKQPRSFVKEAALPIYNISLPENLPQPVELKQLPRQALEIWKLEGKGESNELAQ